MTDDRVYFRASQIGTIYRLLLCLLCCVFAGCSREPQALVLSGPTMGTTYAVKVVAAAEDIDNRTLRTAIDDVLARVDRGMSVYRADSEIARFNESASTDWFDVSADVAAVVRIAIEVSELSDGAFDVTVAPLVNAWGFGPQGEPESLPDDAVLARIGERVGYQKLHVRSQPPALRKDVPGLAVDLNGIAPGFAVDLLAERLLAMGIENFLIDIGGEVRARGRNGKGELWRVAVERPVDTEPTPYAIVQLDAMAVTTSGEYRHNYLRDGRRYSHTIDPRTARPIEHDLASVVVIGPEAAHVDAWATAFNVLGAQAGYALASQRKMPVMFIEWRDEQLRSRMTREFEKYLMVRPSSDTQSELE